MVLISDGNSIIGPHVRSNLCCLICLRHLTRSGAVKNHNIFLLRKNRQKKVNKCVWNYKNLRSCAGLVASSFQISQFKSLFAVYRHFTEIHWFTDFSAAKNNMHNAVGFIREEAAKERGPRDGGETCALMNTSAKMLCHFCSSKGEAFWCCLCGEG